MISNRRASRGTEVHPLEHVDFGDISHFKFVTQLHNVGEITPRNYVIVLAFDYIGSELHEHSSRAIRDDKDNRISGNFGGDHEDSLEPLPKTGG